MYTCIFKKNVKWNCCRSTGKRKSGSGWARAMAVGRWAEGEQGGGQTQQPVDGFMVPLRFLICKVRVVTPAHGDVVAMKPECGVEAPCQCAGWLWLPGFPAWSVPRLLGAEEEGKVQFDGGKALFSAFSASFCVKRAAAVLGDHANEMHVLSSHRPLNSLPSFFLKDDRFIPKSILKNSKYSMNE